MTTAPSFLNSLPNYIHLHLHINGLLRIIMSYNIIMYHYMYSNVEATNTDSTKVDQEENIMAELQNILDKKVSERSKARSPLATLTMFNYI